MKTTIIAAMLAIFAMTCTGQNKYAYLITVRGKERTETHITETGAKADSILTVKTAQVYNSGKSGNDFVFLELYCEKKRVIKKRNGQIKLRRIKNN